MPDDGGRRDRVTLLDWSYHEYGYDDADQLVSADRKTSAGVLVPGYGFGYDYDPAGNMLTNAANGTGRAMDYNELNQLTNRYWTTQPSALDVLGAVSGVGTGVTVNAAAALLNADGSFSVTNLPVSLGENVFTGVAHDAYGRVATNIVTATVVSNRVFSYDANGNMISDGYFTNTWNDADRLVAWESGDVRLEFVYDGQGRRVEKREIEGGVTNRTRYVWDGWLPLAILDEAGDVAELQVWGRDLSGSLEGAGGIGGLLAVHNYASAETYEYFCDAQGNISGVLLDGEHIAASYQYSPFGKIIAQSGPYAARYRFSSKKFNEQSGLSYFGYRSYSAELGRFINRDPIGEAGGINLHAFAFSNPINNTDYLGLDNIGGAGQNDTCQVGVFFPGEPSGQAGSAGGGTVEIWESTSVAIGGSCPVAGGVESGPLLPALPGRGSWTPRNLKGNRSIPLGVCCRVKNLCSVDCKNCCGTWPVRWDDGHIIGTVQEDIRGNRYCALDATSKRNARQRCVRGAAKQCSEPSS